MKFRVDALRKRLPNAINESLTFKITKQSSEPSVDGWKLEGEFQQT